MTTCITNRCSQGQAPCPTPGVCNGNTQPALPIQYAQEEERDAAEVDEASIWILGAACLFAVVALIAAAASVLSLPL